jgi:putative transposase
MNGHFELWAWVFMPEHVHLMLFPKSSISKILFAIKMPVTKAATSWVEINSPSFANRMADIEPNGKSVMRFWQRGGGYDRNIYTQKEALEKIKYMHWNPVRRGLVNSPAEWKWSSFRAWQEGCDDLLKINKENFPLF